MHAFLEDGLTCGCKRVKEEGEIVLQQGDNTHTLTAWDQRIACMYGAAASKSRLGRRLCGNILPALL